MIDTLALVFFVAIGLVLALTGVRLLWGTKAFFRRAQRAAAVVTRLHEKVVRPSAGRRGREIRYFPLVRFTTMDGREVEAMSPIGVSPPQHQPGDAIDILYDPADPSAIRIDTLISRGYLLSGIVTAFGLLLAGGVTLAYMLL
ncbi:DUF3592 domain-containing protein [Streptosporangiaceae bacterium NEAU-GS5]|nr:DUF3592 domain-containing protein [Streptosporangiaceae bacterium NEAU-GS5]